MYTYKLITSSDSWTGYMKKTICYDAYHTIHYHSVTSTAEPVLFVYEEGEDFIALPLLKRVIEHTDLCDFTSSYGYTGPLSNKPFDSLSYELIENFKSSFFDFMKDHKAVSLFSRLNPFLNQLPLLEKIGGVRTNGKTIYIDLKYSLEEQRARYNKRLVRQIRQLRNKRYVIKHAESQEEVQLFCKMYNENMFRVGAKQSYYFEESYFSSLLASPDFDSSLILIYDGKEMICGALLMWVNQIITIHLSATKESHIHLSPSKLLTEEISLFARTVGVEYLHLGGGVGGREDSLFKFKSSFSNHMLADNLWCFIADEDAYSQLVQERNISADRGYFPLYRSL